MNLFEQMMRENKQVTKEERKKSKLKEAKSRRRVNEATDENGYEVPLYTKYFNYKGDKYDVSLWEDDGEYTIDIGEWESGPYTQELLKADFIMSGQHPGWSADSVAEGKEMVNQWVDWYNEWSSKYEESLKSRDTKKVESKSRKGKRKLKEAPEELTKSVSEVRQDLANLNRDSWGVDENEFYTYLKDNGYTVVQALYKDANYNRQSWDFIFESPEGIYVRYSKFGYDPWKLSVTTKLPTGGRERLRRLSSYDDIHDYKEEPEKWCFRELSKLTESNSRRKEAVIKRHPSKYDVANAGRFGNPYDRKFASEEERQKAIKSYEKKIQAAETRLNRNAEMSSPFGGYDNWHEDKDSIGYMYDRLSLMRSAKLKESRRRVTERIRDIGPAIRADAYIEELNNYLDMTYGFYLDEIDQDTFVAVSLDQQVKLLTEDICKEIGAVMLSESTCKLSLPKGRQFAYTGDFAADDDEVLELAVQFNDVIKYSFGQEPTKTPSLIVAQLLTNCYSQTKDPTGWSIYDSTDNPSLGEFWNDIYDKEASGSNIAVISYI